MEVSDSIRRAQPLLGTFVEIVASGAATCDLQEAVDEAFGAVAQVHRLMSFHDRQSDVSHINREAFVGAVSVNAWTYQVLEAALELHRRSAGLFDVTVAPLLQNCGFLPRDANNSDPTALDPSAESAIAANAIELLGDRCVRYRHSGVKIDLGGIAKGFAVDRAIDVLRGRGVVRGLVNAGGDLAVFGRHAELVHIRNPKNARQLLCVVQITDAALASSGRTFDPHHSARTGASAVFDPNTRRPVSDVAGATVRAPSCMIADALTKVVMIAGEAATELLRHYRASALLVLESGEVRITPDWQDAVRLAA